MADIRTKQTRTLRSVTGPVQIQCTYRDKSADDETWLENCRILATETRIKTNEIRRILSAQFPELFTP